MSERPVEALSSGAVAVAGLGNIGGFVVELLAGVPWLEQVVLIDPDRYSASNLGHQRVAAAAIGKAKAAVKARELRAFAPHLRIEPYIARIEDLPRAILRGMTLLCCVDSRAARQTVNAIALQLGVPMIDAALDRAGSVRVRAVLPGLGPCIECAWGPRDYALLEQRTPCLPSGAAVASTAAPMEYGAIAAALQFNTYRRLADEPARAGALAQEQHFLDVPSARGLIGKYAINAQCRAAHEPWTITPLARTAGELTLAAALALAAGEIRAASLAVDGHVFVRAVRCVRCGEVRRVGCKLSGRLTERICPHCALAMLPSALDVSERLSYADSTADVLARPLRYFAIADRDIVSVRSGAAVTHYELGAKGGIA